MVASLVEHRLQDAWASAFAACGIAAPGVQSTGSIVVALRFNCSAECGIFQDQGSCGIFPEQGSNPCLLHWHADPLPVSHQGSPHILYIYILHHMDAFTFSLYDTLLLYLHPFADPYSSMTQNNEVVKEHKLLSLDLSLLPK